jgi:hypothetical protein
MPRYCAKSLPIQNHASNDNGAQWPAQFMQSETGLTGTSKVMPSAETA